MEENIAPASKRPKRLKLKIKRKAAKTATKIGSCNWNPQPTDRPYACKLNIAPASSQKEIKTPAVKNSPCLKIRKRFCPAILTKLKILKEITGKTHGIKFRSNPPVKANNR